MRSLLLALASMSCACACDESQRIAEARAPAAARRDAPPASAAARRDAPPAPASAAPPVAAVDPRETTRRAAHDVLAEHCGECHESHRPTAKPKALAIFDLDQPDWPSRFDDHKYSTALKRLASKSDAARDAFIAFRDAELAASPAKPN
jgi:mono/diheme cytochrome c family protein